MSRWRARQRQRAAPRQRRSEQLRYTSLPEAFLPHITSGHATMPLISSRCAPANMARPCPMPCSRINHAAPV